MAKTTRAAMSAAERKAYSAFLGAQVIGAPDPLSSLTGRMPTEGSQAAIQRKQSTNYMPIVKIDDLASNEGSRVQVDFIGAVKPKVIMGSRNARGHGVSLEFTSQDVEIDMATIPYDAADKMTRRRIPHDVRKACIAQMKTHIPLFKYQRALVHLAGARGDTNSMAWILAGKDDEQLAEQMVNPILAPTYNRHYVVNGSALESNSALATIDTTDKLGLTHVDALASILANMPLPMLNLMIDGDKMALDEPIRGILYVDDLVMNNIITGTTANDLRQFQTNAMQRATYSSLQQHPLFAPSTILWRNILIKKMPDQHSIRFAPGSTVKAVEVANRLTGAETNVTIPGLTATQMVSRSLFLSGQALAAAIGSNSETETSYTLLEDNSDNFGRYHELAAEFIAGEMKVRAKLTNASGVKEVTDYGVMAIDSVVDLPPV